MTPGLGFEMGGGSPVSPCYATSEKGKAEKLFNYRHKIHRYLIYLHLIGRKIWHSGVPFRASYAL